MEAVKPKYTYNPALQNLYRAVLHRLQHPDEPSLPPVPPARRPPARPLLCPAITAVRCSRRRCCSWLVWAGGGNLLLLMLLMLML